MKVMNDIKDAIAKLHISMERLDHKDIDLIPDEDMRTVIMELRRLEDLMLVQHGDEETERNHPEQTKMKRDDGIIAAAPERVLKVGTTVIYYKTDDTAQVRNHFEGDLKFMPMAAANMLVELNKMGDLSAVPKAIMMFQQVVQSMAAKQGIIVPKKSGLIKLN